jgi:spore coat protein A, manganese oxidase
MLLTRRELLRKGGLLAAAVATGGTGLSVNPPGANLNVNRLARFVDPLPIPPIAKSIGFRPDPSGYDRYLPFYRIEMRPFEAKLHRDLKPTRQWGYAGCVPGPTIETRSGKGLLVEWVNRLPRGHLLPVDHNLHGAGRDQPDVRTVAHLHGAKAPPESDGYPEAWFLAGQSALYHYPNQQDAAMLWYHDHAMGITRLNIFAGLLGSFFIRDAIEDSLNLPAGKYEMPLIIYDRSLDQNAQLQYPTSGIPGAPWVPEYNGNAILINGKIFPYLQVEARRYRFRLLNAANFRFFTLSLSNRRQFYQIGTDLGLLPEPVAVQSISVFPAERVDFVIDFSGRAGETITLKNLATDVLQFRVVSPSAADSSSLPAKLRPLKLIDAREAIHTRKLTLSECDDSHGRSKMMLLDNKRFSAPVSEKPLINTREIWELINLTGDSHPIHLHLVRFQILDRRPIDRFAYNLGKTLKYAGPAQPPEPQETGWKDTVRTDPDTVTRIIIPFEGFTGRYIWHCHLLEHEDNEMMRPYEVISTPGSDPPDPFAGADWCIEGRPVQKPAL